MAAELKGLKIAILVANGFEQVEMTEPRKALEKAGAQVDLISPEEDKVKGWNHTEWGDEFPVEVSLERSNPDQYDALMLPGGVMNPDRLRLIPEAIEFVRGFVKGGKPIAAICHAPWTLIDAGAVDGRRITSWPSLKIDLINAGADWVDEEVVRDGQIVTSRKPDDIPAFNQKMVEMFAESLRQAKGTVSG
jgi:deglycase